MSSSFSWLGGFAAGATKALTASTAEALSAAPDKFAQVPVALSKAQQTVHLGLSMVRSYAVIDGELESGDDTAAQVQQLEPGCCVWLMDLKVA